MSTQSILNKDKEVLFAEFEDKLICQIDEMYANDKFLIGKPVEDEELWHTMAFHRLLCTDSCEMTNFINDKIAGKIGCDKEKISDNITNYKKHFKKEQFCDTDIISEVCPINKPEW